MQKAKNDARPNGSSITSLEKNVYLFLCGVGVRIRISRLFLSRTTSIHLILDGLVDVAQLEELSSTRVGLGLKSIAIGRTTFHISKSHCLGIKTRLVRTGRFENLEQREIIFQLFISQRLDVKTRSI